MKQRTSRGQGARSKSPSVLFDHFYTNEKGAARRFVEKGVRDRFRGKTVADLKRWQTKARKTLANVMAQSNFEPVPFAAQRLSVEVEESGLTREEWVIQTERDVFMPVTLLIPSSKNKLPLAICPHGHGIGGRMRVSGDRKCHLVPEREHDDRNDYGLQLAKAGFLVACPDARGMGQRREPFAQGDRADRSQALTSCCRQLALAGLPLGVSPAAMWVWDLRRLLDWMLKDSRVDGKRIVCAGLSGGGLQTLFFSALEPRIKAAVVSGYFYGFREALQVMNENCMCNAVPNLWSHFDAGDLGALIAPRGLMIETGNRDPLNGASGLGNVRPQVAVSRRAYQIYGAAQNLKHSVFDGVHYWNGKGVVPFLKKMIA